MKEKRCPGCMKLKHSVPVCEHCGFDETAPQPVHQIPPGTILKEQYQVGRVLGQGGFGITYIGWDLYLDIPVAIKEYYPNGMVMRDSAYSLDVTSTGGELGSRFHENRERFLREAQALAQLGSVPEIVKVSSYFLANNTAYIVMEYVQGVTLKQYVRSKGGKLSAEELFTILRPVMAALDKVHAMDLVHRDISPDNIMLLPDGGVKLIDFGAVRHVQHTDVDQPLTKSTEAILKHGYAPIEQYQARGNLGTWTDIYALCGTIYYCLTGSVPPDAPERLMEEMPLNWDKIPGLTKRQTAALEKGMALFPKNRIRTVKELSDELFWEKPKKEVKKETTVTKPKTAVTEQKTKPGKKPKPKKGLIAIAAAAVCLLAVAAGAAFLGGGPEPEEPVAEVPSGQFGTALTWALDPETGAMTIGGSGDMPAFTEGAAPWAAYQAQIKTLTIGDEVTGIGENAFKDCENLTAVTIGSGVTAIGGSAFQGSGLTELTVPDSVTTIGEEAFMDTPLVTVTLGAGLESIGTKAFVSCPELASVEFNANPILLEHWDDRIFTADDRKTIPENLEIHCKYGTYAWAYAAHYGVSCYTTGRQPSIAGGACGTDVTWTLFEGGVFVLEGSGDMTKYNGLWMSEKHSQYSQYRTLAPWVDYYDQIRLVYVGDDITSLSQFGAFYNCTSLEYVYLAGSNAENNYRYLTLGERAFAGTGLKQLELTGSTLWDLGDNVDGCQALEYVKLGDSVYGMSGLGINGSTFSNCPNLQKLVVGVNTRLEPQDMMQSYNEWAAWETIPEKLTVHGAPYSSVEDFCQRHGLTFVPEIEDCQLEVYGQCGDDVYWALDKDTKTLFLYPSEAQNISERTNCDTWDFGGDSYPDFYAYKDDIETIRITRNVNGLGDCLFRDLTNLKEVNTESYWDDPSGNWIDLSTLERFGEGLFSGCTSLERFVFPGSTDNTSESVGKDIFENCTSLKYVAIPFGKLPANTFINCPALETIQMHLRATFHENVFNAEDGCDYKSNVTFYIWRGSSAEMPVKNGGYNYVYLKLEGEE